MNSQINLRLSDKLLKSAKTYSKKHGYSTVQELIKETLRDKLFPDEPSDKEIQILRKFAKHVEDNNLLCSEDELMEALKSKSAK